MHIRLEIRCPNCGSLAQRYLFDEGTAICQDCPDRQVVQTECPACDYLLVMCWKNGKVLEAYAPGRSLVSMPPSSAASCPISPRQVLAAAALASVAG